MTDVQMIDLVQTCMNNY